MKILLVLFLLSILFLSASSQTAVSDSIPALRNIISKLCKTAAKENLPLYSGRQYLRFSQNIAGHPFFINETPFSGSIFYDGIFYDSVLLYYDIYLDRVIVNNYTNDNQLILSSEKIRSFQMAGHRFVQLNLTMAGVQTEKPGFIEVLYEGKKAKLYIRHQKKLPMDNNTGDERRKFKENNYYYIEINNQVHAANSRKQLLSALKDKKKEVAGFIDTNKLSYKKSEVELLTKVAAFYDSLIN